MPNSRPRRAAARTSATAAITMSAPSPPAPCLAGSSSAAVRFEPTPPVRAGGEGSWRRAVPLPLVRDAAAAATTGRGRWARPQRPRAPQERTVPARTAQGPGGPGGALSQSLVPGGAGRGELARRLCCSHRFHSAARSQAPLGLHGLVLARRLHSGPGCARPCHSQRGAGPKGRAREWRRRCEAVALSALPVRNAAKRAPRSTRRGRLAGSIAVERFQLPACPSLAPFCPGRAAIRLTGKCCETSARWHAAEPGTHHKRTPPQPLWEWIYVGIRCRSQRGKAEFRSSRQEEAVGNRQAMQRRAPRKARQSSRTIQRGYGLVIPAAAPSALPRGSAPRAGALRAWSAGRRPPRPRPPLPGAPLQSGW